MSSRLLLSVDLRILKGHNFQSDGKIAVQEYEGVEVGSVPIAAAQQEIDDGLNVQSSGPKMLCVQLEAERAYLAIFEKASAAQDSFVFPSLNVHLQEVHTTNPRLVDDLG